MAHQYGILDYIKLNVTYEYDGKENFAMTIAHQFGDFIACYCTPILLLFGSIGNILLVIVFLKDELPLPTFACFFAAICISDTLYLCNMLISWLKYMNVYIHNENFYCQFFTYVSRLCSFISVWFTVALTVERYIAMTHLLKRKMMCMRKRKTIKLLIGSTIVGCAIYIPYLMFAEPQSSDFLSQYFCNVREINKVRTMLL